MQVRYGCGDNYRAFNENLGVSFSDVNRDVKSGSQFQIPPVVSTCVTPTDSHVRHPKSKSSRREDF